MSVSDRRGWTKKQDLFAAVTVWISKPENAFLTYQVAARFTSFLN
jgi:hypothetical protein